MFIRPVGKPEPELIHKILLGPDPAKGGIKKSKSNRCHRIMGLLFVYTIMSLMVVKTEIEIEAATATATATATETTPGTESDIFSDSSTQAAERQNIEKMRAKLQQLQHEQQQQYRQQQLQMQLHLQQMHQQMHQQLQMQLHANGVDMPRGEGEGEGGAGETAYLLERADDVAPIYGTWRTKARRPQPPATALHNMDDNHLYERLPKRSVTMTPLRDQLPRPPRLSTQRPPSAALLRRQFSETPGSLAMRDDYRDYKPKPFNFPFEGPLPEHFKKEEAERPHMAINNIQDILHNLHINNMMPSKMPTPSLVMMPTGLHIAGSYKNLKSSGIANFLRGKRNKKQMQFSIPLPMLQMGMPMSMYGAAPHQRVAIEQLYPFKPRSPQDINLLAMQQPSSKPSSKKNKKQTQSNYNMLLEHGSQQHFVADPFLQSFPPIITLNATRQPQHKRVPFKVNLDIYPVLPPSRPTSVLRNPFQTDYVMPSASASTGSVFGQSHLQHGIYQTPFKFPTQPPTHMSMTFPDQATRYSQQQALYQSQKIVKQPQPTEDCMQTNYNNGNDGAVDTHSNQIMLHLNVFPKQKPTALPQIRASTNPFYNHNLNYNSAGSGTGLQRNAITISEREPPLPKPPSPIEPRQVASTQQIHSANSSTSVVQAQQNQTQQQYQQHSANHSISRSDNLSLLDFEHPIVAAEVPQLPHAAALTANMPRQQRYGLQTDHFRFPKSSHIDQLAAEAQTASLFRFPVEDLIQFQVDDAL
ncbi:uncharacterized protein LOC117787182 [Drosophila innubila]|uniref:uncharacterized protein LOC117787182 n=1 Tax=Drosophila innubila TaxID=198719 RepID=UPI00148C9A08|nr:uncharacterized protein LOC117787182 [Drosophila innubila]